MKKRHPIAKADNSNITIEIPDGEPRSMPGKWSSHYLWIGDENGMIASVTSRKELRKIRNNIDKILSAKIVTVEESK